MPRYERILPLIGITVMGLGLILLVERIHTLTFVVPLPWEYEASVSIAWLVLFFLLIVVAVGAEAIRREEGANDLALPSTERRRRRRLHPAAWIVPMLLTLTTFLFLRLLSSIVVRSVGLVVAGFFLFVALVAPHYVHDERSGVRTLNRLAMDILIYVNAFFLYWSIYTLRVRSLFSATSIVLLTTLLSFVLLERIAPRGQAFLYAAIVGLCVGEVTWPLNYWVVSGRVGGAFLLAVFYMLVPLARHHFRGTLTLRVALEYILVGLLGMVLIGAYAFGFTPGAILTLAP